MKRTDEIFAAARVRKGNGTGRSSALLLAAGLVFGCGADDRATGSGVPAQRDEPVESSDGRDPCALVSGAEVEELIGPLLEDPYRVARDRAAVPDGDGCLYRARDYRSVAVHVTWEGGRLEFDMMAGVGGHVEDLLGGRDMGADTLDVAWDRVALPFGTLLAQKGDVAITVDPIGSRLDLSGAARIAEIALGRLEAPLPYDGATVTRTRAATDVTPTDPCSLVTRAEVEALMGRLRTDPVPSGDGTSCSFPVDRDIMGSPLVRSLDVQWSDGFYALGQQRLALGMATNLMTLRMDPDLPYLADEAEDEDPWDERITLLGGVIAVVKRDVLLGIPADGALGFGEEEALALLRSAAGRIPNR